MGSTIIVTCENIDVVCISIRLGVNQLTSLIGHHQQFAMGPFTLYAPPPSAVQCVHSLSSTRSLQCVCIREFDAIKDDNKRYVIRSLYICNAV